MKKFNSKKTFAILGALLAGGLFVSILDIGSAEATRVVN